MLSLCLCPILTHEPLVRFTSNFHWELGRTSVLPSRLAFFRCIMYEGAMTNSWRDKLLTWQTPDETNSWQGKLLTWQTPDMTNSWHDKLLTRQTPDEINSWRDKLLTRQTPDMTNSWQDKLLKWQTPKNFLICWIQHFIQGVGCLWRGIFLILSTTP